MNSSPAPVFLLAGGGAADRRSGSALLAGAISSLAVRRPKVAYVGVASGDDPAFFAWSADLLTLAGAGEVLPVALGAPGDSLPKARRVLAKCDLIFLGGGDVAAGMASLTRSGAIPCLRELRQAGRPFLGVSAGSILLGEQWVRWADPEDDRSVSAFPCLGLVSLCLDTHGEGEHWEELKTLVTLRRLPVAYGIPSGGGLRVDPLGGVVALEKAVVRIAFTQGGAVDLAPLNP